MFDFTSSKLLILGIVALLVIGPKELPGLLRTLGKYMGIIRKHANEFRAQFDEAMRDSELEALKKEVETIGKDTEATIRAAEQTVQSEVDAARAFPGADFGKVLNGSRIDPHGFVRMRLAPIDIGLGRAIHQHAKIQRFEDVAQLPR